MPNTTEQYVDLNGLTIYDGEMKDYIDDSVVQSNWNESDSTSKAYIQNKPTNLVYSEDASGQITVNNDPYAAMSKIAKIYSSTDTYFPGDVVYKDGNLYRVKTTTITPGTWSSSYVEQIYEIGSLPFRAEKIIYNAVGIPNDYNETVSYSVGDYCYYPPRMESQYSLMYRCTADTSGVFDGSKWIGTTAFHEQLDGSRKMCDTSGSALNVGSVSRPVYFNNGVPTQTDALVDLVYPVGSIYMSVNSTNPSQLFGGTWVAWGSGRVPVGVNTSDTDFDTVEETGGAKSHSYTPQGTNTGGAVQSHTLTTAEIPAHSHPIGGGAWGNVAGAYMNRYTENHGNYCGVISSTQNNTGGGGGHSHGFTNPTFTGTASTQSHLQPYITCYMWKRTA